MVKRPRLQPSRRRPPRAMAKVQPLPNPAYVKPIGWLKWGAETYPDAVKKHGDSFYFRRQRITKIKRRSDRRRKWTLLAATKFTQMNRLLATGEGQTGFPFAQKLKDGDVSTMAFVGEPGKLDSPLTRPCAKWVTFPKLVFADAKPLHRTEWWPRANSTATEGFRVRTAYAPFEEADQFPRHAVVPRHDCRPQSETDGIAGSRPTGHVGLLAVSPRRPTKCLDSKQQRFFEREVCARCGQDDHVVETPEAYTPSRIQPREMPPECGIIMGIDNGEWVRVFPVLVAPMTTATAGTATIQVSPNSLVTSAIRPRASIPHARTDRFRRTDRPDGEPACRNC